MNRKISKTITGVIVFIMINSVLTGCLQTKKQVKNQEVTETMNTFLTKEVLNEEVQKQILLRGKAIPINKISIVSEVQGKALKTNKLLKEGISFKKGELLLKIDNTDTRLNLLSAKSKFIGSLNRVMSTIQLDYPDEYTYWEKYLEEIDQDRPIPMLPEINNNKLRNYLVTSGIFDLYYSIKSQENQLSKYKIYAPYNGSITESYVQTGDMITPNKIIAEYSATDEYEVQASVSLKDLKYVSKGQKITLYSRDLDSEYSGTVSRINRKLDPQTQMATLYLSVKDQSITEGMFLEGSIQKNINQTGFAINRKLLKRNNEVYVIRDSIVSLVPIQILINHENVVYVAGLKDHDLLVDEVVNFPINGVKAVSKN